jgi:hypothetical protein
VETEISKEQQALHAQIDKLRKHVAKLEGELRAVEGELEAMSAQRQQYQLLSQICESLDTLEGLGAASLFWGDQPAPHAVAEHLNRVRATAADFQQKVVAVEDNHKAIRDRIHQEQIKINYLHEDIAEQQELEELAKNEYEVYREVAPSPYRPMVMPWKGSKEDERRFRLVLLLSLLITLSFGYLTRIWVFPPPDEEEVVEIPERLVQLAQKEPPKPPKPEEKKLDKKDEKLDKEKPKPTEKQEARASAEKSGVLAFKNAFSDLIDDTPDKLGADARVSNSGKLTTGQTSRSLVVANAREGSGGISSASLSRNVGGTGNQMGGVKFSRVESAVGTAAGEDRPLSKGMGPSRTDEEIQIVFDRYKAALYRIYNRELRNDPTLRGKMILRITIEPNGTVSACKVESTNLASSALSAEVVDRVGKFNFGAKDGVPRLTILYPIDFLPATS